MLNVKRTCHNAEKFTELKNTLWRVHIQLGRVIRKVSLLTHLILYRETFTVALPVPLFTLTHRFCTVWIASVLHQFLFTSSSHHIIVQNLELYNTYFHQQLKARWPVYRVVKEISYPAYIGHSNTPSQM